MIMLKQGWKFLESFVFWVILYTGLVTKKTKHFFERNTYYSCFDPGYLTA